MRTEKIVFEQDNKQIIQYGDTFFTRVPENGEYFESQDFNTIERAKLNLGIVNIYLDRLKQQYIRYYKVDEKDNFEKSVEKIEYLAMRLFCLDTNLVSFNEIELMEFKVNQSFS